MKKHLLIICTLFSLGLAAQSLSVHTEASYYAEAATEGLAEIKVENLTSQDVEVIVTRNQADGTAMNYMCWAVCHIPNINVSTPLTVPANTTIDDFSGHILSMPEASEITINYCFSLVTNPSDKTCVDVLYTSFADSVGLEEETTNNFFVYPNPAQDKLNINFEGSNYADFVLYDMLGNKIIQERVCSSQNHSVDLSSFESGIYFYSLFEEGRTTEVQKLIIAH